MKPIAIILLVLLLGSTRLNAQHYFPDQCVGVWQGMMKIYRQGQLRDSVLVLLTVEKKAEKGCWKWKMEYKSDKLPMTKDYTLILVDTAKNYYHTDEGDGIVLNDYLFGNKLYSTFETEGVMLTSSYELSGDQLIFEVNSGRKIPPGASTVTNYSVDNLQRVVFYRKAK